MSIVKIEKNGKILKIENDEGHFENIEDEGVFDGVVFLSNHKTYGDINKDLVDITLDDVVEDRDSVEKKLKKQGKELVKITTYIHSGIALKVGDGDSYPFDCRFDSGLFGFLVFNKGEFGDGDQSIDSFVKYWQCLLNGDQYCFVIEDEESGEITDSCGGFVGEDPRDSGIHEAIPDEELKNALLEHPDY